MRISLLSFFILIGANTSMSFAQCLNALPHISKLNIACATENASLICGFETNPALLTAIPKIQEFINENIENLPAAEQCAKLEKATETSEAAMATYLSTCKIAKNTCESNCQLAIEANSHAIAVCTAEAASCAVGNPNCPYLSTQIANAKISLVNNQVQLKKCNGLSANVNRGMKQSMELIKTHISASICFKKVISEK